MAERDDLSLEALDARLRMLDETLARLDRRVRELERSAVPTASSSPGQKAALEEDAEVAGPARVTARATPGSQTLLSLTGRTFLVLAGAFLLRALTEAGVLALVPGVVAALVYGALLLVLAHVDGRRSRPVSATFHAISAALITFPVLLEASTKLGVLSPSVTAIILAAEAVLGTLVAAAGRLHLAAWTFTIGTLATGFVLRVATGAQAVFIGAVLAVGLLTVFLAYGRGWRGPRWFAAAAANIAVLELAFSTAIDIDRAQAGEMPSPIAALTLTAALVLVYIGSIGVRTLVRRGDVQLFEILQSCAALAVGVLGAWRIFQAAGLPGLGLGLPVTLTAAVCYAIAFAFIRRRHGRGRNFFFYAALGGLLTLVGLPLLVEANALPIAFAALALVGAYVGGRFDRITLRAHATVYGAVAFVLGGLASFVWTAFFGGSVAPFSTRLVSTLGLVVLAYAALLIAEQGRETTAPRRLPRFLMGALALSGAVAALVMLGAGALGPSRVGAHALVATAALSAVAVGVAAAGRHRLVKELSWLTYPLLLMGAAKLIATDLRIGSAGTLVLSFACYGTGLIIAPRLLRGTPDRSRRASYPPR